MAERLKFLRKIDRETPKDKTLHLIADNYATHKHPAVQKWLSKHPPFQHALHANFGVLVQHRRALLPQSGNGTSASRYLYQRA